MRGSGIRTVRYNAQLPSNGGDLVPEKTAFVQVPAIFIENNEVVLGDFN
jgi:hypothetical protein